MKYLFCTILILSLIAGCAKSPEEQVKDEYESGLKQLANHEYDQADTTFSRLLVDHPTSYFGLLGRGQVLEQKLLYYDALEAYMTIREGEPTFGAVYPQLARLYMKLGDFDQSWRVLSDYIAMKPEDDLTEARLDLALALASANRLRAAHGAVKLATQHGTPSGVADLVDARLYFLENQIDSADAASSRALGSGETSADYYEQAANYLEVRDLTDSSIAMSNLAVEKDRQNDERLLAHFQRCLRARYFYDARQVLEYVEKEDDSTIVLDGLSMFYHWATQDAHQANVANANFADRAPMSLTAVFYDMESRWMMSDVVSATGGVDALNFHMSRRASPQVFVDYLRGRLVLTYSKIFEPDTDVQSVRNSQGWRTDQLEYKSLEAYFLGISGQKELFDETIGIFNRYHGKESDWVAAIGSIYSSPRLFFPDTAKVYFRRALALNGNNRGAFEGILAVFLNSGNSDSALALFNEFPAFAELYPSLALSKSLLLIITEQIEDGMALFRENISKVSGKTETFVSIAAECDRLGKGESALEVMERLVSLNPENPDALAEAARIAFGHEDFTKTKEFAEKALSIEKDHQLAGAVKARVLYATGDKAAAVVLFDELLLRSDGDAQTNFYYSQALASDKADLVKAGNLARQASFYSRGSFESVINLCEIYALDNRFDLVRGEANNAVSRFPDRAEPYYYLGLALIKDTVEGAETVLQRSLLLGLQGEHKTLAEEMIKNSNKP
ncbi:MAG: hypothetical protein SGI97_10105 [candidate division Zixibacteria bacterium]|nr:hypothetical protein [candidate division Zixibacteria bacterium]